MHHLLPSPTLSFTLPSLHDDLVLDCRLYHPANLAFTSDNLDEYKGWRKRVAVVAHPYAPLGGCYDDPVVNIAAAAILKKGWMVGTFNFRGAASSKGRTSWTSKAEQSDYASFVGFLAYYLQSLQIPTPLSSPAGSISDGEDSHLRTPHLSTPRRNGGRAHSPDHHHRGALHSGAVPTTPTVMEGTVAESRIALSSSRPSAHDDKARTPFLLAGYSYGSLITMLLPELPAILARFQSPSPGSTAAEIRLRAKNLAAQQSVIMGSLFEAALHSTLAHRSTLSPPATPGSPTYRRGRSPRLSYDDEGRRVSSSIRVGGEETASELRRAVAEGQARSFSLDASREAVRRSMDRVRGRTRKALGHPDTMGSAERRSSADFSSPPHNGSGGSGLVLGSKKQKKYRFNDHPPQRSRSTSTGADPLPLFKEAYMLISPLQGMVSHLATMSLIPRRVPSSPLAMAAGSGFESHLTAHESKLVTHPTLAVYGNEDMFTSHRRLKAWAERLVSTDVCGVGKEKANEQEKGVGKIETGLDRADTQAKNQFTYREVQGAGHFWHERGVATQMREAVERFVDRL